MPASARERLAELSEAGASAETLRRAILRAAGPQPEAWAATLERPDAMAVLGAANKVGWDSQFDRLLAGVARNYPEEVLRSAEDQPSRKLSLRAAHAPRAIKAHPEVAVNWLVENAKRDSKKTVVAMWLLQGGIGPEVAAALTDEVRSLDREQLESLLNLLKSSNNWAAVHLDLARTILERARELGVLEATRNALAGAMTPRSWGSSGGESPELAAGLALVTNVLESETDEDMRAAMEIAAEWYRGALQLEARSDDDE